MIFFNRYYILLFHLDFTEEEFGYCMIRESE